MSQAGINLSFNFGLPMPRLPRVVVTVPAYEDNRVQYAPDPCAPVAPVVSQYTYCPPPPVVTSTEICEPQVVVAPERVIVRNHYTYNSFRSERHEKVEPRYFNRDDFRHDSRSHDRSNYRR
jgi:hypothetical protein